MTGVDFTPLGIVVGHATDRDGGTGVTVIRHAERAMRGGSAVVGRATGSRELLATSPWHVADRVDAIMLTGGSAYGLDAAAGVMRWMEERGRGHPVAGGAGVVPIVPAAVVFDLAPFGRFDARPTAAMTYEACDRAVGLDPGEGSVGAGTGATVGKAAGIAQAMKGGVGCWVEQVGALAVGAVAVVNAVGDVRDGEGRIIAGARRPEGGFADSARLLADGAGVRPAAAPMQNTTIAAVVTNAALSRVEVQQLARAATAAVYRRISPAGTSFDGDIVFALCPHQGDPASLIQLESLAVRVLETAIERAVRRAAGRDGIPGLADGAAGRR